MQPLAVIDRARSQVNTSLSKMISLSILNPNGNDISIRTNDEETFEFMIPRHSKSKVPSMQLYNVTSIHHFEQQFYYLSINVTQSNVNLTVSLHVEIRPHNATFSYLLIMKFDGRPQLNSTIKDIDDWSLLCSSGECFMIVFLLSNPK